MAENKRLNPELRGYIKRLTVDTLESCDLFVEVFGKGFAERKFEENVNCIFSNEENEEALGYYELESRDITICASGKDGRMLTARDIAYDEDIIATCVHEAIHAILRRIIELTLKVDGKWVKLQKIVTGASDVRKDGTEIGIGITEGLTEWICKKARLKARSYRNLVKMTKQLEIALGAKKVMQLGKGNIVKRATKILGMSKRECEFFLNLGDQEYTLGESFNFFQRIICKLEGEVKAEYLEKIKQDYRIRNFLKSYEYKSAIEEGGQDKAAEIILEYAKEQLEEIKYCREANLMLIDSTIFDKYFKKEFEQMQSYGTIEQKQLQTLTQLVALMQKSEEKGDEEYYSSIRFQKEFKKVRDKYLNNLAERAIRDYREGKLSGEVLEGYLMQVTGIGKDSDKELLSRLASGITPEYSEQLAWLLSYLHEKEEISDIYRYSIQIAETGENERVIFLKDNKLAGTMQFPTSEEMEGANENVEQYLEIELEANEDFYDIMNDFLILKAEIEETDPKAEIQISDRIIMIHSVNGRKVYMIEDGQIVPADHIEEVEFEFAPNVEKQSGVAIAMRKPIDKIREYLFRMQQEAPGKRLETRMQMYEFKSRISDMSNYTAYPAARERPFNVNIEKRVEDNITKKGKDR